MPSGTRCTGSIEVAMPASRSVISRRGSGVSSPETRWCRCGAALRHDEAHPLEHELERRCRRLACLCGAHGEKALQLPLVCAQLAISLLDWLEKRDHGFPDILLELSVAASVIPCLDRLQWVTGRDGH